MNKKNSSSLWIFGLVFGCAISVMHLQSSGQEVDRSKGFNESYMKIDARKFSRPMDVSKSGIERPLESRIAFHGAADEESGNSREPQKTVNDRKVVPDESKRVIESGIKAELKPEIPGKRIVLDLGLESAHAITSPPLDVSKFRIESATKDAIAVPAPSIGVSEPVAIQESNRPATSPAKEVSTKSASTPVPSKADNPKSNNPKVVPGKIKWHEGFEAACLASDLSGKPVLHFQLLGQLDQRFT